MKYVLMYTNRPDLDATVPEERQAEVYQAIFGWFEKHGAVMVDGGAELQGPETATSVKSGTNGGAPVVVDGPFSEAKENVGGSASSTFPTWMRPSRSSRSGHRSGCLASQSRSGP
jgi:hypothetical protein